MKVRIVSVILVSLLGIGISASFAVDAVTQPNPTEAEISDQKILTSEIKKRIDHLEKLRPNLSRQINVTKSNWLQIKPNDPVVPFRTAYSLVEVQVLSLERLPLICTKGRTTKRVVGPFQKCPPRFKVK